jgi:hypothetical protein
MKWLLPLLLLAASAHAATIPPDQSPPQYLPFADVPTAQAFSAGACATLGCDGVQTKYWWPVVPLTGTGAAVQINHPADTQFGPAPTLSGGKATALTLAQNSVLVGSAEMTLGKLIADMTLTTDQPIQMLMTGDYYLVTQVIVTSCNNAGAAVTLTNVAGGIYTGAGKTLAPIVAATQAYNTLTAPGLWLDARSVYAQSHQFAANPVYLSLTTGFGSPAKCTFIVKGFNLYN